MEVMIRFKDFRIKQVSGVRCQEFNDLGIKGFRN